MTSVWQRTPRSTRRLSIAGIVVAAITVVVVARRDLADRAESEIRGNLDVWRRITFLPGGAIVYLVVGRKRPHPSL